MDILGTLSTVASIFLLLLAGYIAKRTGILKRTDTGVVNAIVVNLTMPAFIFVSTHSMPLTSAMIKGPMLGIVMEIVVLCVAYLIARALKLDRPSTGGLMLAAAFGNTGFLGYPMTSAAFPGNKHALLSAVMFDEFAMAMMINTVGIAIATSFGGKKFEWNSLVEFLKTPLFPSMILALALRTVSIPPVILKTLGYLAAGTVPLAMISIGLNLNASSVKKYPAALSVGVMLKMIMLPVLMYFVLPRIGVNGVIRQVVVLESAVPTAVFAGVIAGRYCANEELVAAAIFITTLISIAALPLVLMLVR